MTVNLLDHTGDGQLLQMLRRAERRITGSRNLISIVLIKVPS